MTAERVTDLQWVQSLIFADPILSRMTHSIAVATNGLVSVEVEGSHYEARAWRHAIDGRILPSHIDVHGVRRQLVIGLRVQVCVVEHPRSAK